MPLTEAIADRLEATAASLREQHQLIALTALAARVLAEHGGDNPWRMVADVKRAVRAAAEREEAVGDPAREHAYAAAVATLREHLTSIIGDRHMPEM